MTRLGFALALMFVAGGCHDWDGLGNLHGGSQPDGAMPGGDGPGSPPPGIDGPPQSHLGWESLMPALGGRESSRLADAGMGKVLLFGGRNGNSLYGETWLWDGNAWSQVSMGAGPSARYAHAMAFDPQHHTIVLHGGNDGQVMLGDTWIWNGSAWAPASGTGPSARKLAAMAADPAGGGVLLFGGTDGNVSFDDTWRWDGSAWTPLTPAAKPSARKSHAMASDTVRHKLVLCGGYEPTTADVWVWDGTNWAPVTSTLARRYDHAMAFDESRGKTVLFGGALGGAGPVLTQETWEWDGASWSHICAAPCNDRMPGERRFAGMAYDTVRGKIVLFGGANITAELGDVWEYQ